MTDAVFAAIDGYEGEGFNNKLENLVMGYLKDRVRMEQEAQRLHELIDMKHEELKRVQNQVRAACEVESRFRPLVVAVSAFLDV